ncbi:DUF4350 domain-containing protein [Halococcus qingdaonensis]|uniref:DUF4350 domain-containing protein n=1 Tax=Halococcus qingdaonensis TaxID=224402 RepID=UPI002116399C|nr:DUF4350 domain-containing protein [Halococcus qingdaonensis]
MGLRDRLDVGYPQLVLVALTVVTVVGLVLAASTSSVAFGSYNDAWDGASELREQAQAAGADSEIVRDTDRYANSSPEGTIAVVLSPESGYGPRETDRLRTFVRNGGTLLVAEDFGQHANPLLEAVGAQARVPGQLLRDEQYNYQSTALPIARNVSNASLLTGVDGLTLNHGSPVSPNGATVLASTSDVAYVDSDRDGELGDGEEIGTKPVATSEAVGDGRVLVVGDPSLFINAMVKRSGNQAFVRSVFGAHERVLLDYSHAGGLPPLSVALLVVRDAPLLQILLGALGIGAIALFVRRPGIVGRLTDRVGRTEESSLTARPEALAAFVRERHPDWDDERTERVIQGIMARRDE